MTTYVALWTKDVAKRRKIMHDGFVKIQGDVAYLMDEGRKVSERRKRQTYCSI